MLRLVNLEELQNALGVTCSLIDLAARKDSTYVEKLKRWLLGIESMLANNKFPEAAKIGALRGSLISSELGIAPEGFHTPDNVTRMKLKNAVALYVIKQVNEILFALIQKDIDRFSEAERIMHQLISVAKSKGLLSNFSGRKKTSESLNLFWSSFSNDPELLRGVTSIEGLVGPYDSLIIFDRVLTTFEPSTVLEIKAE